MHKKDLVKKLKSLVLKIKGSINGANNHQLWKGQLAFASFLISYLENLTIPHDEKYDHWRIEPYLPQILVDAFEQLRTGTDEETARFRKDYETETGHPVPNITDIGQSRELDRCLTIQSTLGFMFKELTGEAWVENKIDAYCNAQQYVLQHTFDKFLRMVFSRGLYEIVDKDSQRGMSGKFGETELRTYVCAGRVMFTFARLIDKDKEGYYKKDGELYSNEDSVSFVGEDSDPLCLSAGIQSIQANFRTSLDMIEDVIKNWPTDIKEQKKVYMANKSVSMGF